MINPLNKLVMFDVENLWDWDYSESEGPSIIRYDFSHRGESLSLWVYQSLDMDGCAPKVIRKKLQKIGNVEYVKFV
jgi:hypothetical protein